MIQSQRKQTRFIQRILYSLKRGYGFPLTLHKVSEETYDTETGKRIATIQVCKIKRAIILPSVLQAKFEFDLAYIAANRNFTYGGTYDTSLKKVIIDARDLSNFKIELEDYFIFEGRRWQVSQINEFEFKTAFFIVGKEVKGTPRYLVEEITLEDTLQLVQEITNT